MLNIDLLKRRNSAVPRGVASATPVFVVKAENAEVWDVEDRRYIDFAVGIAVCNTGHRHPKVVAAVDKQNTCFSHTAFQVLPYETYISLAERLNAMAPIKDAKTLLITTGAEAVENAVKIARHYTKRQAVISFTGGYHGRSVLTLGLTGKIAPYSSGLGPPPPGLFPIPFPIAHHGVSVADSLAQLQRLFKVDIEPSDVAAIILEPVQGEGGFYQAPHALMTALREVCDAHGILLICDEVQTGFGRTGKLFATEHFDIEPDLIAVAKALAGGYPLAGVIGKAEIMDSPGPGGLGGTYGGSPIGCAAAHAVLDVIEKENLCERANRLGARMIERLQQMKARDDTAPVGDIRGLGAMVAFEMVTERDTHKPDPEATKALTAKALEHGLILLSCGYYGNTIRLLAPLTIADDTLEEGLDIIEQSLVDIDAR
jgi:4-aminobutyrate aminotransferase/4-aminobutyrate aminotransferase/(S)-3-amino-2-methylpropionate transaminase